MVSDATSFVSRFSDRTIELDVSSLARLDEWDGCEVPFEVEIFAGLLATLSALQSHRMLSTV